jgi:hypothetical protein
MGQLSELLLQHQAFVGTSYKTSTWNADVFAYTAPRVSPIPITDATLAVSPQELNAKVYISPQFPREYWSGVRFQAISVFARPTVEFTQDLKEYQRHFLSLSGTMDAPQWNVKKIKRPLQTQFGILSQFQKITSSSSFADFLWFVKFPIAITENWIYRFQIQATLLGDRKSAFWNQELEYGLTDGFRVIAGVHFLMGSDQSYFGAWRDQSAASLGVRWYW